ncbi:beta-xylosidase [Microbacterium endophyticum]|uniref:Beta-xylosidase n=1 Tax=Microbacterium endophyticum TaxID=1526412 RepID=A0A7W4V2B4_9MICO|nr:family 43 glycosylhydrolase [Microbacterium endophyticum]MBB2975571.1 beta-xylosidase [Microbacterium endophyticum]NIK35410.1 beta-xylosidase [Microbacterium endophyticum]
MHRSRTPLARPFSRNRALRFTAGAAIATLALSGIVPAAAVAADDGLVAHYALDETEGTVAHDSSGAGKDGTIVGSPALAAGEGIRLDGVDDYVKLPNNLLEGLDSITISMDVLIASDQATPYFIYGLGTPATSDSGDGYLFATGNNYRTTISPNNWRGEKNTTNSTALARGVWKSIAYTLDSATQTGTLYLDGVQVGQTTGIETTPASLGGGVTTSNNIGKSNYAADKLLKGNVRDFRIYDSALAAADVSALALTPAERVAGDLSLIDLGDLSNVTSNLTLPTSSRYGSTVTWSSSNDVVVSNTGRVARPSRGDGDATVTLTATAKSGDVTDTRTFEVTVPENRDATEGERQADLDALAIANADDIRGNITLVDTGAVNGTEITWTANPENIISTSANGDIAAGVVTRGGSDQAVALTAHSGTLSRTFDVTVRAAQGADENAAYLFTYFNGEGGPAGESVRLAVSEGTDALDWHDLKDGAAVLSSDKGTGGVRDPFIIRSAEGDRFYLLATDLNTESVNFAQAQTNGSRYLEIWESTDLVNWSDQRHVEVSSEFAGNTWAPEAFYDESRGEYLVYWASNLYESASVDGRNNTDSYNRIMYATTRDFVSFSEPQVWIDSERREGGYGMIDSSVIKSGDTYFRFTKEEGPMNVLLQKSNDLRATIIHDGIGTAFSTTDDVNQWSLVTENIGVGQSYANPTGAISTYTNGEGPTVFPSIDNPDQWYLFIDQPSYHGGQGYAAMTSADQGKTWTVMDSSGLPDSPRHGTVMPITRAEYDRLATAYQPELLVTAVENSTVEVPVGGPAAVSLPETVTATFGNDGGRTEEVEVSWETPDFSALGAVGDIVTVQGWMDNGSATPATVTFVAAADPAASDFSIDTARAGIRPGETEQVAFTVAGSGAIPAVEWTTSDDTVATVSNSGLVTAVAEGDVTITATAGLARETTTLRVAATPADLQLWYDFDSVPETGNGATVADLSGNGRDGTINGAGAATVTGSNGDGRALDLPGGTSTSGAAWVGLPTGIIDADQEDITYSAWLKPDNARNCEWNISLGESRSRNSYLFDSGLCGGDSRAGVKAGATETLARSAKLATGNWTHLAIVLDGGSKITAYVNGTAVSSANTAVVASALAAVASPNGGAIGRSPYNGDPFYGGAVDDVRVYGSALTATQVASVMEGVLDPTAADADTEWVTRTAAAVKGLPFAGENSDVTGNILLPETLAEIQGLDAEDGAETVKIEWSSSDTAAISETDMPSGTSTGGEPDVIAKGRVTRASADKNVTLTATITRGGATEVVEIPVTVKAKLADQEYEGYAFAYFTGNTLAGEKIYMAASDGNDALSWSELNDGQPVLESEYGTKGLRDPFVIRSPEGDKFYLIATDLSIGGGTSWDASQRSGSRYLEVWESTDLINWSEQRHVRVSPDEAGNTWAPEAYYDESIGEYVVFWASKLYDSADTNHTGSTYNRMMYATTRDFVTFSEPQIWQDGTSRIDSTVLEVDDVYYRFTKDEGAGTTGCSDIIQESSESLRAPLNEWTMTDSCIGRDAGTQAVEGPSIFKANEGDVNGDGYYLFVDEYGGRGYIPLHSDDIANPDWKVPASFDLPASPRHGTVVPVTAAELEALSELKAQGPDPVESNEDGEILRYDFTDGEGTTLHDSSGNGYDATIAGGTWTADDSLSLNGTSGQYVDLPDNILSGVEDVTVETEVWIDPTQSGNYFIYNVGNTDSGGVGNGYFFATGDSTYRSSIASGNWSTEQTVNSGTKLERGRWAHLTYTLEGTTARLYLDGIQVAEKTGVTLDPGDIGGGATTANYLGRSAYNADNRLKGQLREFAIYDRALSAGEVLAQSGNASALVDITLEDADALKVAPIIDSTAHTVVFPVKPGTDVTALTPVFASGDGATVAPASGTTVDLSSPVTYTLTAEGGEVTEWTMSALVMASPVLPGYYADPNIAVFGGTYYIYATTDGYSGWGGKDFYVWSSTDLVEWTRSAAPILTLDSEDGNVPWASGNAWAPTITEKDGKYYFYFSGHNDDYGRKTIGVAIADSPDGPFTAQPEAMVLNNETVTSGQAIDPAAFLDPVSGDYYLFWGNGSPVYAKLSDDMTSLEPGTISRINGLTDFREGAFVNYRDGLYHLTYSIDDTGSENYRVGYATATSIDGPWTYRGVILQKDLSLGIKGTGHSSIINVPGTDDWYIAYHRFGMPGGDGTHRETTIDKLTIGEDGLFQTVTPTLTSVAAQTVEDTNPLTVAITGDTKVGETLSIDINEEWTAAGIQWTRNGSAVAGATAATYELTDADVDATIGVQVTGAKALWPGMTVEAEVGPIVGSGTVTPEPTTEPTDPTDAGADWADVSLSGGGSVEQGGTLRVSVTGLAPGQQIGATLRSEPIVVTGIPAADASGSVYFEVPIPSDFALGAHRLIITSPGYDDLVIGVSVVAPGVLAVTGAQVPLGILLAAIMLLVIGGMIAVTRRRRMV